MQYRKLDIRVVERLKTQPRRNQEILENYQILVEAQPSAQSPLPSSLVPPSLTGRPQPASNTPPEIVGQYHIKKAIYKLYRELPNDLRRKILGNQEISRKSLKCLDFMAITQFYLILFENIITGISLRILTGKKHRQIKLQCLEKVRIWAFGLLVH